MTANLQLPLRRNPSPDVGLAPALGLSPSRPADSSTARSWWSIDRSSSAPCFPSATSSIAFEHATRLLTSSVAAAASLAARSLSVPSDARRLGRQASAPPRLRQKPWPCRNQDAFPRRVPSPPHPRSPRLACASPRLALPRSHRRPATVSAAADRLRAPFRLRYPDRGFPRRRPSARPNAARQSMALSPTPLVDLCNQNSPRAQPRTFRTSTRLLDVAHPARAGLEETSRRG